MLHTVGPLLSIDVGKREYRTEDIDDVLESLSAVGRRHKADTRISFDAGSLGVENRFTTGDAGLERELHGADERRGRLAADRRPAVLEGRAPTHTPIDDVHESTNDS